MDARWKKASVTPPHKYIFVHYFCYGMNTYDVISLLMLQELFTIHSYFRFLDMLVRKVMATCLNMYCGTKIVHYHGSLVVWFWVCP